MGPSIHAVQNIDRPEAETQGTRAPLAPHEDAPGLRRYTLYALFLVLVLDVFPVQHCRKKPLLIVGQKVKSPHTYCRTYWHRNVRKHNDDRMFFSVLLLCVFLSRPRLSGPGPMTGTSRGEYTRVPPSRPVRYCVFCPCLLLFCLLFFFLCPFVCVETAGTIVHLQ